MYLNYRPYKKIIATPDVPIMCLSKRELAGDTPGKWMLCSGSFDGTLIVWELERLAASELRITQVKQLPLAYG